MIKIRMSRVAVFAVMAAFGFAASGHAEDAMMMKPAPEKAEKISVVGGATMYPTKNIVENASNSQDHTTLVAAVKAADLAGTLQGKGPFTVFAPTNDAFKKLPPAVMDSLLKPENKAKLAAILTYHVVPAAVTSADIAAKADAAGGKATYATVQGGNITLSKDPSGAWWVADEAGNKGKITVADVAQSNGVIQVIDAVLMPTPAK